MWPVAWQGCKTSLAMRLLLRLFEFFTAVFAFWSPRDEGAWEGVDMRRKTHKNQLDSSSLIPHTFSLAVLSPQTLPTVKNCYNYSAG